MKKGFKQTNKTKEKIKEARKRQRPPFLGKNHTEKTKIKIKKAVLKQWQNPEFLKKGIKPPHYFGEKSSNWKGGITPENRKLRASLEYKLWRKAIFERDNFTCQKYGTRGGELVAHHINNFSDFSELRFAIDNGITLSKKVHIEFHQKYGRKNNTKEQLKEFLK